MATPTENMVSTTVRLAGFDGDEIEAYVARPSLDNQRGGVVVIHHMPGFDRESKEAVRRIASLGYDAIAPNLHYRDAPGAAPDDAAAANRANGGVSDEQLTGDVAAAAAHLRSLDTSNRRVGVIGFCSGGRQAVLAGCTVDVQAAIDCYGAFVVEPTPEDFPIEVTNLLDRLPDLRCPLLGLFGNDDQHPAPADVDELDRLLRDNDKIHEFHRYDGAGHAFFSVDRPNYRVPAAQDGWERVTDFFERYL